MTISAALPDALQASLLNGRGYLAMNISASQKAQADLNASLALSRDTALIPQAGQALSHLAYLWIQINRFQEARTCLEQCLDIAKELDDQLLEAYAYRCLGITAWGEGHVYQAIQHSRRAYDLFHLLGDQHGAASSLKIWHNFWLIVVLLTKRTAA